MKTDVVRRILVIVLTCSAATPLASQELPVGFGWFAGMIGSCWVGEFPDGRTEHTHCYTSQYDKLIRGTAALADGERGARQVVFEGDSVFAWDESSGRIVYYIWGSDGSHSRLEAQYVGDELHFPVPSRADPSRVSYRSVWRRIDDATLEVRRERPQGEAWVQDLVVTYRKRPAPSR